MWKQNNYHLVRVFEFRSLAAAVEFIKRIALLNIESAHLPFWEEKIHLVVVKLKTRHNMESIPVIEKKIVEEVEEIYFQIRPGCVEL